MVKSSNGRASSVDSLTSMNWHDEGNFCSIRKNYQDDIIISYQYDTWGYHTMSRIVRMSYIESSQLSRYSIYEYRNIRQFPYATTVMVSLYFMNYRDISQSHCSLLNQNIPNMPVTLWFILAIPGIARGSEIILMCYFKSIFHHRKLDTSTQCIPLGVIMVGPI